MNDRVGRVRFKLADLLCAAGLEITAYDLTPAEGRARNNTAFEYDGVRWWGRGTVAEPGRFGKLPVGIVVLLYGYDTMTACVRTGVKFSHQLNDIATHYDVFAEAEHVD